MPIAIIFAIKSRRQRLQTTIDAPFSTIQI